jgi:hypothetical protein
MAEAGREFNERVSPQQLSLIDHRESDYSSALERRFFCDAAHTASRSHKRIPESLIASGSNEISVARKHRLPSCRCYCNERRMPLVARARTPIFFGSWRKRVTR